MPVLVRQVILKSKEKCTISPKKNTPWQIKDKNRYWSASLTVEAALIVPLFFFVVFLLWQIFLVLMVELKIGQNVTETLRTYSHLGYVERKAQGEDVDIAWMYTTLLWSTFPNDKNITDKWIECETQEDERILVKITYRFLCKAIFFPTISVPVEQNFRFYAYFGEYEEDKWIETVETKKEVVYMTEHGTVYHTSKACVYLNVMLKSVSFSSLFEERNQEGEKYTECSKCVMYKHQEESIYISSGGNKYHWSLQCPAIKRIVIEKNKEDVEGVPICHKCGKMDEENTE